VHIDRRLARCCARWTACRAGDVDRDPRRHVPSCRRAHAWPTPAAQAQTQRIQVPIPKNGDRIYCVPWGNIAFCYNAAAIGYSDQTIHLGTYHASLAQLKHLEGEPVTIEVAH